MLKLSMTLTLNGLETHLSSLVSMPLSLPATWLMASMMAALSLAPPPPAPPWKNGCPNTSAHSSWALSAGSTRSSMPRRLLALSPSSEAMSDADRILAPICACVHVAACSTDWGSRSPSSLMSSRGPRVHRWYSMTPNAHMSAAGEAGTRA